MTSYLSHSNTRNVCLCVWVWEQHYKYELRTLGSLSITIGRSIPSFSKCFPSGQVLLCQKHLSGRFPRELGEITAQICGHWHHEAKDGNSEYLTLSEHSAYFLFEDHLRRLPCCVLIPVMKYIGWFRLSFSNVFLGPLPLSQLRYLLQTWFPLP